MLKRRLPPRLQVLSFLVVNSAALLNLGLLVGRHGSKLGLAGLYALAIGEGGVAVMVTPGISRLGRAVHTLLALGIVVASLCLWPQGQFVPMTAADAGPAILMLMATLIVVGPGWGETRRHP